MRKQGGIQFPEQNVVLRQLNPKKIDLQYVKEIEKEIPTQVG